MPLMSMLQESVKGIWNGDVDLGDSTLQELREEYDKRRTECHAKELKEERQCIEDHIKKHANFLELDINFLARGLVLAQEEYVKKFNSPTTSKELLKTLCWERVEFSTLLQQAQRFKEMSPWWQCLIPLYPV
jgi:hypothetical protein